MRLYTLAAGLGLLVAFSSEAFAATNFESSKLSPGVVVQGSALQSPKLSSGVVVQSNALESSKLSSGVVVQTGAFQSSKLSVGIVVITLQGTGVVPRAPLVHW